MIHMYSRALSFSSSGYQKLLSWEPLFDLECLVVEGVGQYHHCGDTVTMKCTFHYNGPTVGVVTRVYNYNTCLSVCTVDQGYYGVSCNGIRSTHNQCYSFIVEPELCVSQVQ